MGTTGVDTMENLKELIDKHAFDLTQQLDVNTRFLTYLTKSHLLSPSELLQFQRYDSQPDRVRTILKILPKRDNPNANFAFIESLRQSGQEDLAMLLMGGKSEVDVISHYQSSLQLQFHEIKRLLKSEVSELERNISDPENANESSTKVLWQMQTLTESTIKQLENCEQILDRLHEDCLKIAKANIDMLRKIETVDSTIRSVLDVGRRSYFPKKKAFSNRTESTQSNNKTDDSVNRSPALHSKYHFSGRKLQADPVTRRSVAKVSTGGEYIRTSDFRTCVQISEKLLKEIKEGLKSEPDPQYGTKLLVAGKETSFKYQSRARPTRSNQTFGARTSISSKVGLKNILLERLMEIDSNFLSYANRLKRSSKGRGLNANKPLAAAGYRSRPLNKLETVAPKKKTSKGVQTDNSVNTAQEERKLAERASQIAKSLDQRNNEDLVKILDQMHRTITERVVSLTTSNPKLSRRPRPLSAGQKNQEATSRSSAINHNDPTKLKYDYRTAGNKRTVVLLRDFSRELKAYTELELQLSAAILNEKKKTTQKEEIIKIRDNELKSYKQIVTAIECERDTFKRLYERANKSIPLKPIRVDPRRHGANVPEQTSTNVSEEHEKPEAEQKHPVVTVDV